MAGGSPLQLADSVSSVNITAKFADCAGQTGSSNAYDLNASDELRWQVSEFAGGNYGGSRQILN